MELRQILERLQDNRRRIMIDGLASVMLVAGLTKFVDPGVWAAYQPAKLSSMLPLTTFQKMYLAGFMEASLALMLFLRRKVFGVSMILTLWLSAITLTVLWVGSWSVALRDVGLVILALSVALEAYEE